MRVGELTRIAWPLTGSVCSFIVRSIPEGLMFREFSSIWKSRIKPYSSKFWKIPEGNSSGKSFKRLHRYKYSPTAWYGNNEVHLHPWEPRRLSVREALRIQTVPDTYVLPEQFSLSSKFKMICNGVPCRLARCTAESLSNFFSGVCVENLEASRPKREPLVTQLI